MSFWDQYFLPRSFISTRSRDNNFFRFFQIFANFDTLDTSNGRSLFIHDPIWEILAVVERAWRGESRGSVGHTTPLTPSVKEFICDSADGFFCLFHSRVLDQLVLMSKTLSFMKIFRSHFTTACTRTVANVPKNYNFLGWCVGGKMGVRKKNFFPVTFLPLS
jgi:hypothetical protein